MSPTIRIDDDVYAELQKNAVPFVDTPNSVIRRVLGLDPAGGEPAVSDERLEVSAGLAGLVVTGSERDASSPSMTRSARQSRPARRKAAKSKPKAKGPRAAAGTLLPETTYELPLLQVLDEMGGVGPARDAVSQVGEKLKRQLTEADREKLGSGAVRWQNRVQFVRLSLVKQGLMSNDVPRGMWGISDAGRERLRAVADEGGDR